MGWIMNERKKSARAGYEDSFASIPSRPTTTEASPQNEVLSQRKYQKLIRKHLDKLLDRLFAEFTGLHFRVAWSPGPIKQWETQTYPAACSVCSKLSGSPLFKDCRICGQRQLSRALKVDGNGHCFTCRLGVRNYWFPIRVRDETLGITYLQALQHPPHRRRHENIPPA
jgi:hypothetical protein